ncbi:hypothetical protein D3C78_1288170 [compost metagenome]
MNTGIAACLLAQRINAIEQLQHSIKRVHTLIGACGCMRGPACVLELQRIQSEGFSRSLEGMIGMCHKCEVTIIEEAGFRHGHLRTACLFGRRTVYSNRSAKSAFKQSGFETHCRRCAHRADQMVPAGMADFGKGVVFAQKTDRRSGFAGIIYSNERGVYSENAAFYLEAELGKLGAEQLGGKVFLMAELGPAADRE